MKISTFAKRLSEALEIKNVKASDVARATGIPESAISSYKNGQYEAKQDRVYRLSAELNVSPAWLMGYDLPMHTDKSDFTIPPGFEPLPKMVKKPLIGSIACGEPILAEENIEEYVDVPEDKRCDFCLRCKGDSMIEAGIRDNDVVYIHIQSQVENGQIAAVRIGGEATLKRVFWDEEQQILQLNPANSSMSPRVYSGQALEDIQIEGLAVGFMHWF